MSKQNDRGGGSKKYGRSIAWCTGYKRRKQRERNKLVRVGKHVLHHPNDSVSTELHAKLKRMF